MRRMASDIIEPYAVGRQSHATEVRALTLQGMRIIVHNIMARGEHGRPRSEIEVMVKGEQEM
jgi:hypothetical protein